MTSSYAKWQLGLTLTGLLALTPSCRRVHQANEAVRSEPGVLPATTGSTDEPGERVGATRKTVSASGGEAADPANHPTTGPAPAGASVNGDNMNPAVDTRSFGASGERGSVSGAPDAPDKAPGGEAHIASDGDVFATADLAPKSGSKVSGQVRFATVADATGGGTVIMVTTKVVGATPGDHGLHIHETGDCAAPDASSAGGHLNPEKRRHGGPDSAERHLGDLGNLRVGPNGEGQLTERLMFPADKRGDVRGLILGKAIVLHAKGDDLTSQPAGNSGGRIACGVIQKAGGAIH